MGSKNVYKLDENQNKLFEDNIQLVNWVANNRFNYIDKFIPFDEKQQLLLISLAKACCTFQEDKGYKFASYAVKIMSNDCGMYMRKVNKDINSNTVSLDNTINDELTKGEFNSSFGDIFEDKSLDVENDTINKIFIEEIQEKIKLKFGDKYMQIYNMIINEGLSQREVSDILNISQAWVCRVNKRVIKYIRKEYFKAINNPRE